MKISEIYIRDPFILAENEIYYLYGTRGETAWGEADGFDVFKSRDLENWEGPFEVFHNNGDFWADKNYWAPEVYKYQGAYYMLATFCKDNYWRGVQILKSDSPMGPFSPHSNRPLTPQGQWCIDGTLYVSQCGTPYMVFQRETRIIKKDSLEIVDDEMCAVELSDDLKIAVGEPFVLFAGSECPSWMKLIEACHVPSENRVLGDGRLINMKRLLVEGPFLYRTEDGRLIMTWASFSEKGYVAAVSESDSGELSGKWKHAEKPLFDGNGGHGMLFKDFDGNLYFTLHLPNSPPGLERPRIFKLDSEPSVCSGQIKNI